MRTPNPAPAPGELWWDNATENHFLVTRAYFRGEMHYVDVYEAGTLIPAIGSYIITGQTHRFTRVF